VGLIDIDVNLGIINYCRPCFFMIPAMLVLPLVVLLPLLVEPEVMSAIAPVTGIIAVPRSVLRIPRRKTPPFVSIVIIIAKIIVAMISPDKKGQKNDVSVQNNAWSIIIIGASINWLGIVAWRKHHSTTGKLIVPVSPGKNIASWGPHIVSGDPDHIGLWLTPIPWLPGIAIIIPEPASINPDIIR
jgi:hypothetical protein